MNRVENIKPKKAWRCFDCWSQKDLFLVRLYKNDPNGGEVLTLCEKHLKFYRKVMVDEPEVIE